MPLCVANLRKYCSKPPSNEVTGNKKQETEFGTIGYLDGVKLLIQTFEPLLFERK